MCIYCIIHYSLQLQKQTKQKICFKFTHCRDQLTNTENTGDTFIIIISIIIIWGTLSQKAKPCRAKYLKYNLITPFCSGRGQSWLKPPKWLKWLFVIKKCRNNTNPKIPADIQKLPHLKTHNFRDYSQINK